MWTGILIYLYKWRAPCSLIVRNFFFSPAKVVCVASHCALFRLLLFLGPVFFVCAHLFFTHFPSWRNAPTTLQRYPSLLLRWFIFVPLFFGLILDFLLVFFLILSCIFFLFVCFWFEKKHTQTNQDRDKLAVVHAKMNCVKTKLVPLFFIFCNGLLLNISIYWYIKSDWKTLSCVLFVFFVFALLENGTWNF